MVEKEEVPIFVQSFVIEMFASGSLSPFMGFIKGEVFCLPL